MKQHLRTVLAHRLALTYCASTLLAGGAAGLYSAKQLDAAEIALSTLDREINRKTQALAGLRPAASALDGLVSADPAAGNMLNGIAAVGKLSFAAEPGQRSATGGWVELSFRLHGPLLHEEALLDILERWSKRSPFQHQVRQCSLQRQGAGIVADCRLALLLPAAP